MRISYTEDENFAGQFELWQANCQRSLRGKKGQAALKELKAALLALPSKRLIADKLDDGVDCCAVGALVRYKQHTPKADPEYEMEEIGVECGMPRLIAWKVVAVNDVELKKRWEGGRSVKLTPEERFTAMLEWVDKMLDKKVLTEEVC